MTVRSALRVVRWVLGGVTLGGATGASVAYLHHHDWDVRSSGLVRFGRAAFAITCVVIDYKRTLRNSSGDDPEYAQLLSQVHRRSAERLRDMCSANGGCFIKVGQHIAALDYLVPTEYVQTLRVFHNRAPQTPVARIRDVIREDLGKNVDELFYEFDATPVGVASLAQVHGATLRDGSRVAVKVQHPDVKAHSFIDINTMELLVRMVAWMFPEFQFMWLAEETRKNLPLELDFEHEAHNCERVARMFSHFDFLKVPRIHWDLTSERVLTMEFCEGGKVDDLHYMKKHNIPVNQISRDLGRLYSEMIFVQGYVHCDPHPGNLLVHRTDHGIELVLLDHGLYTTLTDEFRLDYSQMWLSLIRADLDGIRDAASRLGAARLYGLLSCIVTGRSWGAINRGIGESVVTEEEDAEIRNNATNFLPQISEVLNSVPREMLLVLKTNDLLRHIESVLRTRADATSLVTMSRSCIHAVYQHRLREHASSWVTCLRLHCEQSLALARLALYEWFLWATSSSLAKTVSRFATSGRQTLGL